MQMQQDSSITQAASDIQKANIFSATERVKAQQGMVQSDQQHQQKLQQMKQINNAKTVDKKNTK